MIDASTCLAWFLPDESRDDADEAYRRLRAEGAMTPRLWWFEVRNVLLTAERRRRNSTSKADEFMGVLASLPIRLRDDIDETTAIRLARRYGLSFYDASYLGLARLQRLPLATLDKKLGAAALSERVEVVRALSR